MKISAYDWLVVGCKDSSLCSAIIIIITHFLCNVFVNAQAGEQDQLLKSTKSLLRASESLHRAQVVSAQTGTYNDHAGNIDLLNATEKCLLSADEVADGIVLELGTQRESLIRTRERVSKSSGSS